jgi:hypothetical protein
MMPVLGSSPIETNLLNHFRREMFVFLQCKSVASPPQVRTTDEHAPIMCVGKRTVQLRLRSRERKEIH